MADTIKVFHIDAANRLVTEKQIKARLDVYQKLVGGNIEFVMVGQVWPGHGMYADEEGLIKRIPHGFRMRNGQDIVGNAVLFGMGGSKEKSAKVDLSQVLSQIQWLGTVPG